MLFHRLARLGSRIVKDFPKERHLPKCGMRSLQRSYGQYLGSLAVPQKQTKTFQEVIFSNNLKFCTSYSTASGTEKINVTFVDNDGVETHTKVPVGINILEAARENDIPLGGYCEGSLECTSCHVVVMDIEYYNKLGTITQAEEDMLDMAFGLTRTSRLGCQVILAPELDGIRLLIPSRTRIS